MSGKITFGKKSKSDPIATPVIAPVETPKPRKTTPKTPPRKPRENYRPVKEGDLHQIIIDALKGNGNVDNATFKTMKSGFARRPFGGDRKGGGGWNSTAYAVIEAFERSGKVYIKKES